MLSCVDGLLPTNIANIHTFSQINAQLEYYFSLYKIFTILIGGRKGG